MKMDEDFSKYRNPLYPKLAKWKSVGEDFILSGGLLWKLLGYSSEPDMLDHFNDRDREICRAMLGPHGYAVFKAYEARMLTVREML